MWQLRERRPEDLPGCVEILREVHRADRYPLHWPDDPEAWLTPEDLVSVWIAEDAAGVLGGHVVLTKAGSTELRMERLFVAPTARRTGAVRRLLDRAIQQADLHAWAVSLEVADNGVDAIGLYRRSGWQPGRRRDIDWGGDTVRQVLEFRAPFSPLVIEPAVPADAPQLLSLRETAARWQLSRGLSQWLPGELTLDDFRAQIDAGGVQVVRDGDQLAGSIRLLWADPAIWGEDPDHRAGYVHGLMTRDRGTGLGRRLRRWAEHTVLAEGRSTIRLDCVSTNDALREFYRRQGFREVGLHVFAEPRWSPVITFEKKVTD